jgi:hypothetical protein
MRRIREVLLDEVDNENWDSRRRDGSMKERASDHCHTYTKITLALIRLPLKATTG